MSLVAVYSPLFSQSPGHLTLQGDKLAGSCEVRSITGIEIFLETDYAEIDSAILFGLLPAGGVVIVNETDRLESQFRITGRAGFPQILFKIGNSWFTFDNLVVGKDFIRFTVDGDPDVPFARSDLEIIRKVRALLADEQAWHQHDDRDCEDDIQNQTYSLFCALRIASIEIDGYYNHRNAVMQKIRHLINERHPGRRWAHRLRDFNNIPETTHDTIMEMLDDAEEAILQAVSSED
jgi:hypothetical protein